MTILLPENSDPARSWNPVNTFWKIFSPALNPSPDASPVQLTQPAPIWDLPSPYGAVHHPENKDNIPYFVSPDYFAKLTIAPTHPVVHADPPFWMVVSNFTLVDAAKAGAFAATAPAFSWFHCYQKQRTPTPYVWFASALIGLSTAFVSAYMDSETRLQGYAANETDVQFWTQRADYERKVLAGEIDPRKTGSWSSQSVYQLFGAKRVDLGAVEAEYYKGADSKDAQPPTSAAAPSQ